MPRVAFQGFGPEVSPVPFVSRMRGWTGWTLPFALAEYSRLAAGGTIVLTAATPAEASRMVEEARGLGVLGAIVEDERSP